MKKRILAIITAALLLTLFAVSASAATTTATTEKKNCAVGDTVTLNVSVSSAEGVTSGAVEVVFDNTKLELVDGSWNTSGALLSTFDKATNKGAFAYQAGNTVSGRVFSVTFKVLSDAPLGETAVECKIQLKAASADLPVTNVAGSVNIGCKHEFTKQDNSYPASPASCTSAAKYYYSCAICGEKGVTTYMSGDPTSHTYDKKVNTAEYLVSSVVTCADTAEFYYSCVCGAKGSEKFTEDASFTHSYTESWLVGKDGHWRGCSVCKNKKDYEVHIGEVCSVCSFVTEGDHFHSFGAEYKSNGAAHWQECACGEKQSIDLHTSGTDNKCTVCGRELTVTVVPIVPDDVIIGEGGDIGDDAVVIDIDTIRKENDLTVAMVSAAAAALAIAVLELIVFGIVKAAKRKKAIEAEPTKAEEKNEKAE